MKRLLPSLIVIAVLLSLPLLMLTSPSPARATNVITETFYASSDDGYLYNNGAVYATVHDAADAILSEPYFPYLAIGQTGSGAPTFWVWRSLIFFDTSNLPDEAVIETAYLYLYGKDNQSTTDFLIKIVPSDAVTPPIIPSDYGAMENQTNSLGEDFNTSAFVTNGYNLIALNDNGKTFIDKSGVTSFGLRSNEDSVSSEPTNSEYVAVWASERGTGYAPKLVITYSIPPLAAPTNFGISYPGVFTNYAETGDQLYVFRSTVDYSYLPAISPQEAYTIQLYSGATLIAENPLIMWGYKPASIYLNADNALTWESDAVLMIVSRSEPDTIFTDYELTSGDWKGSNLDQLDTWVQWTTAWMEIRDGVTLGTYHTTVSNEWKLDNEATYYFATGVYGLDIARPDLFIVPGVGPYPEDINDYSGTSSNLGGYWSSIFNTLGESVGLSGKWLAGIAFFIIATIAVIVVRSKTNESPISVLACIPVMWAGTLFGVPMFLAGIASAVAIFFLFRDMVLARS